MRPGQHYHYCTHERILRAVIFEVDTTRRSWALKEARDCGGKRMEEKAAAIIAAYPEPVPIDVRIPRAYLFSDVSGFLAWRASEGDMMLYS